MVSVEGSKNRSQTMLIRLNRLFGKDGFFPIGRTKGDADFILHHDDNPFIPDTDPPIERMRLIPLGERAVCVDTDDAARVMEALKSQAGKRRAAGAGRRAQHVEARMAGKERKAAERLAEEKAKRAAARAPRRQRLRG
jgi:hypothetical protein